MVALWPYSKQKIRGMENKKMMDEESREKELEILVEDSTN